MDLQELSTEGKWWFPENENKKFFGNLTYDHLRGGVLLLSDTSDKLFNFPYYDEDIVLFGEIFEDQSKSSSIKVSVLISSIKSFKESLLSDRNSVEVQTNLKYIFLGLHLKYDRLEFSEVSLAYSGLENWLEPTYLPSKRWESSVNKNQTVYSSSSLKVNKQFEVEIISSPEIHREKGRLIRERNVCFLIRGWKNRSLDNYRSIEQKIRNFLNFIVNKEVLLQVFEGTIHSGKLSSSVKILYPTVVGENMNKVTVKSPFLFDYSEISDHIERILNRWFLLYDITPEILDLYFGVMYNTQSYLSNNFLMLFTALEVYYRAFLEKRDKKVTHSKDVITGIYDQFGEILPCLSSKIQNRDQFVMKIVNLRNNLVHGKSRYDKIDNDDLFWEQKNLQLLLQLCILLMLEFTFEEIKQFYLLDKVST